MSKSEPVMYFVVNADLKMGAGKMAAQVAHAAIDVYRQQRSPYQQEWVRGSHAKVVLTAPENTLFLLHEKYPHSVLIVDEGRTQIESGSITVLAFPPGPKEIYPDLSSLKLHR